MPRPDIIDTHVHFWNRVDPDDGMTWDWLERGKPHPILGDIGAIKSDVFDIESLVGESRFAGVRGFVHVQAAIGSTSPVLETRWLTRMREAASVPFTIVAHADLGSPDALAQLDAHGESPYFVGVRDFATEAILASGAEAPLFEQSLAELSRRDLMLDLDCEWQNMHAARRMAQRHPDLPVVLEHIGYPRRRDDEYFAAWRAAIIDLAGAENVVCKISGLGMTDPRFTRRSLTRWIDTCLEAFGPDRCVLGSNWPIDRLYSSYDVIMDLYRDAISELSADEQERILSRTAERLYKL